MAVTAHTAQWQIDEANKWVFENPYAWQTIKNIARAHATRGHHVSMRHLMNIARFDMYTKGLSEGFKVNNSITPFLARKLIEEVPETARIIETRKSKVDKVISNAVE